MRTKSAFFKTVAVPLSLLILNIYLKVSYISVQAIAGDEPFSIYVAQFNASTIIEYVSKGNNPPLFELLLHVWIKLFGITETAVRMLPCLLSSLTLLLIYGIGKSFFSTKVAVVASLLFTFSSFELYFAHETRAYSLFMFLGAASMLAYLQLRQSPKSKKYGVLLVLANSLLIYTHFLGFFVPFVQLFATLILKEPRQKLLKRYILYSGIVFLLYAPYLPVFLERFYASTTQGTWISPVTNLGPIHDVLNLLTNRSPTNYLLFLLIFWLMIQFFIKSFFQNSVLRVITIVVSIFFLFYSISVTGAMPHYWEFSAHPVAMGSYMLFSLVMITLFMVSKKLSTTYKMLLLWFFLPLITMYVASYWVPMFIERYLIFITPAFYILVSAGVAQFEKKLNLGISLLMLALMGITLKLDISNKRDVRQLIDKVKEIKTDNSIIYICPDHFDINFAYYYNQAYFKDIKQDEIKGNLTRNLEADRIYPVNNFKNLQPALYPTADKIIYIDAAADFSYPGNEVYPHLHNALGDPIVHQIPEIFKVYEFKVHPE